VRFRTGVAAGPTAVTSDPSTDVEGSPGATPEPSTAKVQVNRLPIEQYFPSATHRMAVTEPLRVANATDTYVIDATITGGGISGQAGALRLGIARALVELDPELRTSLKRAGLLTRDSREKESKKYGLKKARKAPQYSKR
jgi:small subunit ribosomal protein S9